MSGLTICQSHALPAIRVSSNLLSLVFVLFLAVVPPIVHTQPNPSSSTQAASGPSLELGKPIEREIAGGEVHQYDLSLQIDQYVHLEVDQRGIDLALWIFDPTGKKISESDAFRVGEKEEVGILSETSGNYRVEVHTSFPKGPAGRYEIKITEIRPATERDKVSNRAGTFIEEAFALERKQNKDDWRKAIEKYEQALPLWQSIKDTAWEANTLYLIAGVYINLADKQKSFDFANRAVSVAETVVKDSTEQKRADALKLHAWALDTLGRAYQEFGDKKKALEIFGQALSIRKQINDRPGTIVELNNLAIAYQSMGEPRKSLEFLTEISELLKGMGDRAKEASFLNNICVIHENIAEYTKALEYCNKALSIRRDLNDERGTAPVLNSLGNTYGDMGQYERALDFYTQSQAVYKKFGNDNGEAIEFNNLGWLYAALGDYEKAIDFYNRALEIFRKQGNQFRQGNTLSNIAANYADLGDFKKALEINQEALKLRIASSNLEGEAVTYNNIASCYSNLGDKQKALEYYKRSIEIHRTRNPRQLASALRNVGALYRELGEMQKAIESLNEALEITRRIGEPSGEAGALSLLAQVERDQGKLLNAKLHIETALASVESLRVSLKDRKLRTSFFASVRRYHEVYIDVLMRLHKENPAGGFDVAALKASENARARSLLESLIEASAQIGQGVEPSLVARERTLRQLISDKAELQQRLLSGSDTEERAKSMAKDLDALTAEYDQVQVQIRQSSPKYTALIQPVSLSLQEIQSRLLDQDTVLLEYALGEEKSYVFLVSSTSLKTFELPKRNDVEGASRRVYDLVTASDRVVPNETLEQRNRRLDQADSDYPVAATTLSRMLLGPLASELKNKRLIIVGEGVLQYVPFGALPEPANQKMGADATSQPLIAGHEVITLPSASVLGVIRRETTDRPRATKTIAVFADPVFGTQDPRIDSITKSPAVDNSAFGQAGDVKRSAEESGLNGFPRLRFSRQEAEQIMRLVTRNNSFEAVDFAANRTAATSPDLKQYRIVHFATHGLINSRHADLSGIVLSLVNEEGKPQNGFLRLYDIYNLNLSAELVVLSACQTALGKDIKGEGLVGLTRAFMYAGASRIVASLWRTEDRATAVLMNRFYESMLTGNGMSPAAALRKAQLSMWQDKRWKQPRYWAAFTLQGEWK